jgi:hypothetical protein
MSEQESPLEEGLRSGVEARLKPTELSEAVAASVKRAMAARKPKASQVKIVSRRALLWDRLCALSEYIGPLSPHDNLARAATGKSDIPALPTAGASESISLLGEPSQGSDRPVPYRSLEHLITVVMGPNPIRLVGDHLGVIVRPVPPRDGDDIPRSTDDTSEQKK